MVIDFLATKLANGVYLLISGHGRSVFYSFCSISYPDWNLLFAIIAIIVAHFNSSLSKI
jgi:hypothetical protein